MEHPDSILWSRVRDGDADAFGLLFERYVKTIYNYCFRRTGEWGVAEDLVSITFLEAWRRREKDLAGEKVLPWLYGIATNVLRTRRRSEARFASALRRVAEPRPAAAFDAIVDERLDDERQMQSLLRLLAQLPKREQDVFVLCAWSELSYEEAALALGIPIGTVRSRLSRARQRLRELDPGFGHEQDSKSITLEVLER
jgi:RNA polymerase sigma factor (sigma-70 family)